MATGTISLPLGAAMPGDGSTNNNGCGVARVKSSAAAPSLLFTQLLFDASTKEMAYWGGFRMPSDYASAPVMIVQYKMASATSGGIALTANLAAITPGDTTDADAKALAADNTATQTVPTTAGYVKEVSIPLTNADSLAAGDWVVARLAREVANASDTATGDLEVISASLEYTTA